MPSISREQRDWVKAAIGLVVIAVIIGYWWHLKHPAHVTTMGMAAGTVVKTDGSGDQLDLTVDYTVDGHRHQTTGSVDAARFRADGKVVWVCYSPKSPADTDQTRLRLPTDPLCAQKK